MDYQAFVDGRKTLLVSPAGYGKTHTIAECLKYTSGKQLILTHTHAGVASIKEKIKAQGIPSSKYSVETISGFAQRYVRAFYVGVEFPSHDDQGFHAFIINKAREVFSAPIVQQVIATSYQGLLVDEYQDCTKPQHAMNMELSKVLPIHILGDPLQGIFDFNDEPINFETDLADFEEFPELTTPWRWTQNGNTENLGRIIKGYRERLIKPQPIEVADSRGNGLRVYVNDQFDLDNRSSPYWELLQKWIKNERNQESLESLLIIIPEYVGDKRRRGDIIDRTNVAKQIDFSNSVSLLEAIDSKDYYLAARAVDDLSKAQKPTKAQKPIKKIYDLASKFFLKSSPKNSSNVGLNDWLSKPPKGQRGDWRIIDKTGANKQFSDKLKNVFDSYISDASLKNLHDILLFLQNTLKLRRQRRRELYNALINAIEQALLDRTSVYEAMVVQKNRVRRAGRKIYGKCIGTTLLTKGLEFDTVVILDAHKFQCPKHLYVALSRCCKNLIIFTAKTTLP